MTNNVNANTLERRNSQKTSYSQPFAANKNLLRARINIRLIRYIHSSHTKNIQATKLKRNNTHEGLLGWHSSERSQPNNNGRSFISWKNFIFQTKCSEKLYSMPFINNAEHDNKSTFTTNSADTDYYTSAYIMQNCKCSDTISSLHYDPKSTC